MNEIMNNKSKIYDVRGQRVMLDFDVADMYGVETKTLNQAVKRNIERFPADFMFKLTKDEWEILRPQLACDDYKKRLPYAFSDLGLIMLSSVLQSQTAVLVSRIIIRTVTCNL